MDANATDPPTAFFTSLSAHYAARSDVVSPRLFAQLCKDYNVGKFDEADFYVAVCRFLFSTHAYSLVQAFKTLLPAGWNNVDLSWLDHAVEDDVERERKKAKGLFGRLATCLLETDEGEGASEVATVHDGDTRAASAVQTTTPTKKKKTPINGFRASYIMPVDQLLDSPASPRSESPETSPHPAVSKIKTSSAAYKTPASPKQNLTTRAFIKTQTPKSSFAASSIASSTTSSPSKSTRPVPSAASVPHYGPIYPTTRAILSRPHKPYIHAICDQHFGNPAEVKRHHDGQSGRPGCWEKSGKPQREWDEHETCKIGLADLEYVKVLEGYVVTDWKDMFAGVREGEEEEGLSVPVPGPDGEEGAVVRSVVGRGGAGIKRKLAAKLEPKSTATTQPKPQQREAGQQIKQNETSENGDEDGVGSESDQEGDGDDYEDIESVTERAAKRSKTVKAEDSISEVDAAVRAAALGLRARK